MLVGLYKVSVFITNPSAIDGISKNETVTSLFSGKHSREISGKSNCVIVWRNKMRLYQPKEFNFMQQAKENPWWSNNQVAFSKCPHYSLTIKNFYVVLISNWTE